MILPAALRRAFTPALLATALIGASTAPAYAQSTAQSIGAQAQSVANRTSSQSDEESQGRGSNLAILVPILIGLGVIGAVVLAAENPSTDQPASP